MPSFHRSYLRKEGEYMQVFYTILSGIAVYLLGQWYFKFYMEPVKDLLKCIGETTHVLGYYANVFTNPGVGSQDRRQETREALRDISCKLRATNNIVKRNILSWPITRAIPTRDNVNAAAKHIMGISNAVAGETVGIDKIIEWEKETKRLLNIELE